MAFIVFSISCYTKKLREVRTAADWKGKKAKILAVDMTSGEYIEFSKKSPGRIYGDKITGTAVIMSKKVEINRDNIKEIKRDKNGKISEIIHKDGKTYHAVTGIIREINVKDESTGKEEDRIIFLTTYETSESVTIPLSEVKSVLIKRLALGFSLAATAGIGVLALIAWGYIRLKSED